jgi:peptidoglycan hydrolase-like protein with peptidoglycan-binding domain
MPGGWLPASKYERLEVMGCTGPGTMHDNYAWCFILHSTESPPGSIDGINNLFRSKPCSAPHFAIDPMGTRRRTQYIPWTWSAAALKGGQGGYQTNRGRAVQLEIVGYTRDTRTWPDDALRQIADVIADCIADGCPINPHNTPDMTTLTGTLATASAPQRLSPEQFKRFDGIAAHVYVPFNDHYDTAWVDSHRIRDLVLEILAGRGHPAPPPVGGGGYPPAADGMLREGMSGGVVKMLQELITGMGYGCGPSGTDGVFGPATTAAVRRLQADHGLDADGIVGPATNQVIADAYAWARTPPPPPGPAPAWPGRYLVLTDPMLSGDDVRQWQAQMAARGWRLDADGWYGLASFGVAKTFQAEKSMAVDGVVGPATWNAAWAAPIS